MVYSEKNTSEGIDLGPGLKDIGVDFSVTGKNSTEMLLWCLEPICDSIPAVSLFLDPTNQWQSCNLGAMKRSQLRILNYCIILSLVDMWQAWHSGTVSERPAYPQRWYMQNRGTKNLELWLVRISYPGTRPLLSDPTPVPVLGLRSLVQNVPSRIVLPEPWQKLYQIHVWNELIMLTLKLNEALSSLKHKKSKGMCAQPSVTMEFYC